MALCRAPIVTVGNALSRLARISRADVRDTPWNLCAAQRVWHDRVTRNWTYTTLVTGATMKRAGKIGRLGRAAIVAALSAGFVLIAIPVANAGNDWELVDINKDQSTTPIITKIDRSETILEPTLGNDWE